MKKRIKLYLKLLVALFIKQDEIEAVNLKLEKDTLVFRQTVDSLRKTQEKIRQTEARNDAVIENLRAKNRVLRSKSTQVAGRINKLKKLLI